MGHRPPSFDVPERFLQQIWKHRKFATEITRTTDNRPVTILNPGVLNTDGGPDFLDARIRIGGILYRGDVELHQTLDDWSRHAHDKDPKYNSVILHVVFRGTGAQDTTCTASNRIVPVLVLEHYLTLPFNELWQAMVLDERAERLATLPCSDRNGNLGGNQIKQVIQKLAVERMELKMRRYDERLKELITERHLVLNEPPRFGEIPFGINPEDLPPPVTVYSARDFSPAFLWEQLFFEGFMEALGYSKNQLPFLKLARNVPLQWIAESLTGLRNREQRTAIEGLLFGISGLLKSPQRGDDMESGEHTKQLQQSWKRIQPLYHNECCDESEWQFFRLRPENFPTVRLAGASQLIARILGERLLRSVIGYLKSGQTQETYRNILQLFIVEADGFWSTHYRFGEATPRIIKTLIGASRADDIVQNVVLPICLLYARIFKDKDVREAALGLFEYCKASSPNSILQTIDTQLIRGKFSLNNAKLQQGALQLYKFYCAEKRCRECAVGKEIAR